MKKMMLVLLCFLAVLIMFTGMSCAGLGGGDMGSLSSPVTVFASEEKAWEYQYVGTELGVPWDLMMLADGIYAYANDQGNIEDVNPLWAGLQFCILVEEKQERVETAEDGESTVSDASSVSDGSAEATQEAEEWVTVKTKEYIGEFQILGYYGEIIDWLEYKDVNSVITAINEEAERKSSDKVRYVANLVANPDLYEVLRDYICLDEKNIEWFMSLYEVNYMAKMYGFDYDFGPVQLPEVVVGEATRQDLAKVAVSLLNHPYMMGGKSSQKGQPQGPLDCSGFVDWVYIQCFGQGVSNGTLPEGVAVAGTALQWYACEEITEEELKVGDLGFLRNPATMLAGEINHVGIYIGTIDGESYWVHCGGKKFATASLSNGRVGISKTDGVNNYNPVTDEYFSPGMKQCAFKYFRRPQFQFAGDV